jgi:hypothetical protein
MLLNASCPYCGRRIRKFGLSVLKPGIITCPECGELVVVTGLAKGCVAYVAWLMLLAVLIAPFRSRLNDGFLIYLVIAGMFGSAIWVYSIFLGLRK